MPYIKKLVLKGFKSFASQTEIPFANSMNVVVGPNGSGKSNISDAICFVLGRMSIKSMRAAKASNLIFAGSKSNKPAGEASVKLVLDNSDKAFSINKKEIMIERAVRKSGQGIYRIDGKNKTRQEVIELLSQAGIDPYGFNIVLQGEIQSLVKMQSIERREIIEEVAGISIYESRKKKSLKELEKTEERLKEVFTTLRERRAYLKNLEQERKQALRYKDYKKKLKIYKASILKKKIKEKQKNIDKLDKELQEKKENKNKYKQEEADIRKQVESLEEQTKKINSTIEKSSGVEQESLNNEISNLRADLAGLEVRKENNESRTQELGSRKKRTQEEIENLKKEITNLKEETTLIGKRQELNKKKDELEEIEKQKRIFYNLKEKISSLKERIKEKQEEFNKKQNQSIFLIDDSENISKNLKYSDLVKCEKEINKLKSELDKIKKYLNKKQEQDRENDKLLGIYESKIKNNEKIKNQVSELDICPLCKNKITEQHINQVRVDCDKKISELKENIKNLEIEQTKKEILEKTKENDELRDNLKQAEKDFEILKKLEQKKEQIKQLEKEKQESEKKINELEILRKKYEKNLSNLKDVEEKYDKIILEIQEISARTEENVDAEQESKQRDLEKAKITTKQLNREVQELKEESEEIDSEISSRQEQIDELEQKLNRLEQKNKEMIEKRNILERQIHDKNTLIFQIQNKANLEDRDINNLKVDKARLDAEIESLDTDFEVFKYEKILNQNIDSLEDNLKNIESKLENLGSVNLKALEVYDSIKKEYDSISEKAEILDKEKLEILKIIEEIDKKKKRTFMKTLKAINEIFIRNFSQLSQKGKAMLVLENKQDIFEGGLDIEIKVGKGKYFDISSLSGGEKTLVALSLIFAIQEYKPYCFYIFDEVDAALDKRNSERLAGLIKKHMKAGQYIIITHNDAIITESAILYGISMQEGVSKIVSLEI